MQLAEFFSSQPSQLWQLAKQMNVNYAVGGLPWEEKTEKPWDLMPLIRMKQRYADHGLTLSVIESMPPSNHIKLGTPGREEEIEIFQKFLINMGAAGIPVLCYNFMAQFNWFRTSTTTSTRGGALVSSYDHSLMKDAPLTEAGIVTEEQLWENLQYFMERIVPVAEEARVQAGAASGRPADYADPRRLPHPAQRCRAAARDRSGAERVQRHHAMPRDARDGRGRHPGGHPRFRQAG